MLPFVGGHEHEAEQDESQKSQLTSVRSCQDRWMAKFLLKPPDVFPNMNGSEVNKHENLSRLLYARFGGGGT